MHDAVHALCSPPPCARSRDIFEERERDFEHAPALARARAYINRGWRAHIRLTAREMLRTHACTYVYICVSVCLFFVCLLSLRVWPHAGSSLSVFYTSTLDRALSLSLPRTSLYIYGIERERGGMMTRGVLRAKGCG